MTRKSRRTAVVLGLLLLLACGWAVYYHFAVDVLPYDDAYITFRYADRLASGKGMTYNDGERVFGSSSPLYALWLAGLKRALPSVPTPVLAVRGNVVFFLLCIMAMAAVVRTLAGNAAGLAAAALLAAHPSALSVSGGGMESFLFASLLLAAVWCCATGRLLAAAAFAGLSPLARPEGLLALLAVPLAWWLAGRPRPLAFTSLLLLPGCAWAAIATLYYGTPIPHSITAKLAPLYLLPPAYSFRTVLVWLGRWTLPGVTEPAPWRDTMSLLLAEAGAIGLLLDAQTRRRGGWLVAVFLNLLIGFYALTNPMLFDWYTANFFIFWLPSLLVGLPALGRWLASGRLAWLSPRPVAVCLAAGVVASSLGRPYGSDLWWGRSFLEEARSATRLRTIGYRNAALWLNGVVSPSATSATVATAETGAFGYYWRGKMLDACGLVSPQALPFLPVPASQRPDFRTNPIPLGLLQATRPEYVATLEIFARTSILDTDWFARSYKLIGDVPLPQEIWGSTAVLLFRRVDPPAPNARGEAAGTS